MASPRRTSSILRLIAVLAGAYLLFVAGLYVFQDRLIFHRTTMTEERWKEVAEDLHADYATIRVDAEGHHLQGWFLPAKAEMAERAGKAEAPIGEQEKLPTVIFFGGNAMRLDAAIYELRRLQDAGVNLLLVDYRGYGLSEGNPSAEFLKADAEKVFDAAASHPLVDKEHITAWGYSLGAGVAAHLASKRPIERLILFAPFTSLSDLAAEALPFVPVRPFFRHEIDSLALAPALAQPALIVYGEEDDEYGITHAEKVAAAWGGPKELLSLPSRGHQDLLEDEKAWEAVMKFLTNDAK